MWKGGTEETRALSDVCNILPSWMAFGGQSRHPWASPLGDQKTKTADGLGVRYADRLRHTPCSRLGPLLTLLVAVLAVSLWTS